MTTLPWRLLLPRPGGRTFERPGPALHLPMARMATLRSCHASWLTPASFRRGRAGQAPGRTAGPSLKAFRWREGRSPRDFLGKSRCPTSLTRREGHPPRLASSASDGPSRRWKDEHDARRGTLRPIRTRVGKSYLLLLKRLLDDILPQGRADQAVVSPRPRPRRVLPCGRANPATRRAPGSPALLPRGREARGRAGSRRRRMLPPRVGGRTRRQRRRRARPLRSSRVGGQADLAPGHRPRENPPPRRALTRPASRGQ